MIENKRVKFALDLGLNILIIVGLALVIRTYLVSPFHVYGPSMCDTLNFIDEECVDTYGEYIIVNEIVYHEFFGESISNPKNGDVIVFRPPNGNKDFFVKRIIGSPGDKIKIQDGLVYRWSNIEEKYVKLDESSYLSKENLGRTFIPGKESEEFEVPEDSYFAMGDNRTRSTDSRVCFRAVSSAECTGDQEMAFVPRKNIRGKAWVVFWPPKYARSIKSEG